MEINQIILIILYIKIFMEMYGIKIIKSFTCDGVLITQSQYGTILEIKGNKALCKVANFGQIITEWFDLSRLTLDLN